MAHSTDLFDCAICLGLLEDPVTTTCGHTYCMNCINTYWDTNHDERGNYSCPQCRQSFNTRPVLKRNTILATLLDEYRKTTSQSAAASSDDDDTYALPGDVQCDFCTGRKRKAHVFCQVCLASYCETHLKPHFEVPPLRKHKLIKASARIKESICGRHDKLLELYCRTDRRFLCLMCAVDEHKGHDTVSVTEEKQTVQRHVERTKENIADRVLFSETKMEKLKDAAGSIRDAAWQACDDFERFCEEQIHLYTHFMRKKCSEMRKNIGETEKAGVDWTKNHLSHLKREASELRRRERNLCQLSQTDDPIQFLQGFQALGDLSVHTDSHKGLDNLAEFVTAQKDKMKNMCNKEKKELFGYSEKNMLLKMPSLEKTFKRTQFLDKYKNSKLEVDPDTVAACLNLSNTKKEISWGGRDQAHPDHPHRFTFFHQALCKKGLRGNHYWEVEWDGGIVDVAVSYKEIKRKGSGKDCCFGHNPFSWKLTCSSSGCVFWHNNLHKGQIPPAHSCKVGVHLDYEQGKLAFYSVSGLNDLTLLHQIQTTFTEPLYPGFSVDLGATLKICNI